MSKLERLIRKKGGQLVKSGKHIHYRIGKNEFILSRCDRSCDDHPTYYKYWNFLRKLP